MPGVEVDIGQIKLLLDGNNHPAAQSARARGARFQQRVVVAPSLVEHGIALLAHDTLARGDHSSCTRGDQTPSAGSGRSCPSPSSHIPARDRCCRSPAAAFQCRLCWRRHVPGPKKAGDPGSNAGGRGWRPNDPAKPHCRGRCVLLNGRHRRMKMVSDALRPKYGIASDGTPRTGHGKAHPHEVFGLYPR